MKTAGIILIIVSICGIAWLGLSPFLTSLPDAEPQPTRGVLATPTIQQAQPTATNQPTATATPWYDLPATQAAIDAARAEAEKAQAEKDLLILQMTKDAADITNRLALDESERESEDLQARIGLAYTNATATAQAHSDAVQVQMSTIRIEQKWQDITILVIWVIVGIAITGALVLMLKIWRSVDYRESGDSIEDDAEDDAAPVQPAKSFLPVSGRTMHSATVPVSDGNFKVWALAMLSGATAGENKWTDANSPFTTTSYPPFLEWAERKGYVAGDPGLPKLLTDAGKTFCRNWLIDHGITPPPEGFIPIPG